MSNDDDIQWLMSAKGVPRKVAAEAYKDAEKAAKARRPRGLAALDHAVAQPGLREQALRLLDEPARQPAAVEALARVKQESRQPLAACRAALAEAGYDADQALALLRSRSAPAKPRTPNAEQTDAAVIHSLHAMSGADAARVVVLAQRRRPASKAELRELAKDRPNDLDRCVVFPAEGGWRRRDRSGPLDDVWVDDDGRTTVLREGTIHTLDGPGAARATQHVFDGARPRRLAGCHGAGEVAFDPFPSSKRVIWWRPSGGDWSELPQPASVRAPLHVVVTKDRIWLSGGQTIACWDGRDWRTITIEQTSAQPRPGMFTCFAVSPTEEVLASREGTLFAGDGDRVREVFEAGPQEVSSIAHFAGSFWVAHTRRGICRWSGDQLVPVASIEGLAVPRQIEPLRLSARATLLAMSAGELLESADGLSFRTVTTAKQIAAIVGTSDVYWAPRPAPARMPLPG